MQFGRICRSMIFGRPTPMERAASTYSVSLRLSVTDLTTRDTEAQPTRESAPKIQRFLEDELSALYPDAAFFAEEDGEDKSGLGDGYTFIIDPIDGTSNFMNGLFPSVISVGLFKDGRPYIGVVYDPYDDLMFTAQRGMGAFRNGERIHSLEKDLAHSLVDFGTAPYYPELQDLTFALARKYMTLGIDIRHAGTAAWDLCLMAQGSIGIFYELKLEVWDFAAGALIAEEAGCRVTDAAGLPLTYDRKTSVMAASAGVAREGYYLPADVLGINVKN